MMEEQLGHYRDVIAKLKAGGSSEYELNLACWLGERAHYLLAEIDRLRGELEALKADPPRPAAIVLPPDLHAACERAAEARNMSVDDFVVCVLEGLRRASPLL